MRAPAAEANPLALSAPNNPSLKSFKFKYSIQSVRPPAAATMDAASK